jgi:DNA-binding beta-propeller fold protein YncE
LFVTLRHMHQPAGNRLRRSHLAGIAVLSISFAAVLSTVGCGNQYRPVVYAIAISSPSSTSPGLLTSVDFAGDSVLSTPQVLTDPSYFQLNANGTQGFVINSEGSLDTIPLSNPTTLLTSNVVQTTLPVGSNPVSISSFAPASGLLTIFIPQAGTDTIAAINSGTAALYDTVGIQGGGTNPVYVVGASNTPRVYAISQNTGGNGQVDAIETVSTTSLVTVLNVPSNALDTLPTGTTSPAPGTLSVGLNPVWADLNSVDTELVVLNQGDATHAGTLSVINIPLCNAAAQATNPNCSTTNPVDAAGFGQTLATVPVGFNPTMVSVLQANDGNNPAAYVINQLDSTGKCGSGEGSVTVVNLQTNQVTATICGVSGTNATVAANGTSNVIFGHPNSVSATGGEPTGKVYITSSDSQYLSVLYTDTNTVQTHIPLQGNGLRVLVTQP